MGRISTLGQPVSFEDVCQQLVDRGGGEEGDRASEVVLARMGLNGDGDPLMTWPVNGKLRGDELAARLNAIAEKGWRLAQQDVSTEDASVRYAFVLCRAKEDVIGRVAFRLRPPTQDREAGEAGEPPTPQGHVAQLMRHQEVLFIRGGQERESMSAMWQEENKRLREDNRSLNAELTAQRRAYADLESSLRAEKAKVEEELRRVGREEFAEKKIFGYLDQTVPALAGKLMPRLAPSALAPIAAFFQGLDDKQKAAIMAALRPEQQQQIVTITTVVEEQLRRAPAEPNGTSEHRLELPEGTPAEAAS